MCFRITHPNKTYKTTFLKTLAETEQDNNDLQNRYDASIDLINFNQLSYNSHEVNNDIKPNASNRSSPSIDASESGAEASIGNVHMECSRDRPQNKPGSPGSSDYLKVSRDGKLVENFYSDFENGTLNTVLGELPQCRFS